MEKCPIIVINDLVRNRTFLTESKKTKSSPGPLHLAESRSPDFFLFLHSLYTHTRMHTVSLSLSHKYTCTHTLSLSHTRTRTHTLSLSLTHTNTHAHIQTHLIPYDQIQKSSRIKVFWGWMTAAAETIKKLLNKVRGNLEHVWADSINFASLALFSGDC